MNTLIHVLQTALPVFAAIAIGMLCRVKGLLSREGVNSLKRVATEITLPAVLFGAFATADYSPQTIRVPILIFVLCCVALGLGMLLCRVLKLGGRLTPYLMTGFEAGMLGYGLFALLYKGVSNSEFAIIDLGQVLFVFTLYRILLTGEGGLRASVKAAATSPVLWAIIIGLIFGATGLFNALKPSGVADILTDIADFIAAPTSLLILLSIGFDLEPTRIRWKRVIPAVGLRVVIMAAILGLGILVNNTLLGGQMHTGALVLMCILPPPFMLPVFSDVPEERSDISSALSALTVVTLVLFACLAATAA